MITVHFFAHYRERLNCDILQVPSEGLTDIEALSAYLAKAVNGWQAIIDNYPILIAINQTMVNQDALIAPGDEVAFFPPVTGG